jgi:DHA2 family multidrug resistance protein
MNIIWPAFLQGIGPRPGVRAASLPVAYATLDRRRMAEAAACTAWCAPSARPWVISIVTTLLAHQSQILWNELGAYVSQYHEALHDYMRRMGLSPTDPRGLAVVAREVGRQAQMGAMLAVFKLITWSYIFMVPLVFLLKRSTTQRAGPVAAARPNTEAGTSRGPGALDGIWKPKSLNRGAPAPGAPSAT